MRTVSADTSITQTSGRPKITVASSMIISLVLLEEAVATLQASLETTGATVANEVLDEEIVACACTYVAENELSSHT